MVSVDRNFPEDIHQLFADLERDALIAFYQERYKESVALFQRVLDIVLREQRQIGRAFHKGSIYYNMGLAIIGTGDNLQALTNILFAYIEDVLNQPFNLEDEADRAPAARFLMDAFMIQLRLFSAIKNICRRIKRSTQDWLHTFDPQPIFDGALEKIDVLPADVLSICGRQNLSVGQAPLGFPQPWDRRVFIGTNYDTHAHLIPEMRVAVISRNHIAIAARDVTVPQGTNTHEVSLVLLHTCGWAVFDVTCPAGQIMEIERARDYGVHVLLVRSDPVAHPPYISQMINSLGYPLATYRDMATLRQAIINFLPP
jgi:hypothetical protein